MIEIGGKPILRHILKIYSSYGINQFIICCGYKSYLIKEYFANYFIHNNDVTFDFSKDNKVEIHNQRNELWKVTLIDTGEFSQTAGRLKRIEKFLDEDQTFCFTYGDGLADINILKLINHHKENNKFATLSAVQPPGRFGALKLNNNLVENFQEKPDGDNSWISGGFFVLEPNVLKMIKDDQSSWEHDVLPELSNLNELSVYRHKGFWQPMDTLRDKNKLEELWENKCAPWKIWEN